MADLFFAVARRMRFVPYILLPASVLALAMSLPALAAGRAAILLSCVLLYAALLTAAFGKLKAARVVIPAALAIRTVALTLDLRDALDSGGETVLLLLLGFQLAACVGAGVAVALNRPYSGSRNFARLFSLCALAGGLLGAYQHAVFFLDIFRLGQGFTGYASVASAVLRVFFVLESLFFIQLGVFFGAVTRGGGDYLNEE